MLKRTKRLRDFEKEQIRSESPDYFRNLEIYEALHEEAVALGVLPPDDPMEAARIDIQRTRVFHVRENTDSDRGDA